MSLTPALCGTLLFRTSHPLDTPHGRFTAHEFTDLATHQPLLAVARGDLRGAASVLARVHSSCVTGESIGSADCDCAEQLDASLARIAAAGRGVLFYLLQEGRGAGLVAKARDRMWVQSSHDRVTTFDAYARMGLEGDCRRYDAVGFAAAALGIEAPLELLSNNPDKLAALRDAGVVVSGCTSLAHAPSAFNLMYLAAKSRSGHALDVATAAPIAAELPEPVDAIEPAPVATVPSLLHVASYLVPVLALPPAEGVHWLRLHLYVERDSGRERVVLTLARARDALPLVHVHAETLTGRFPRQLRDDPWRTAVERIATRGAGVALFLLHDEPGIAVDGDARAHVAARPGLARLLAAHLPARAELLSPHPALAAALAAAGVATQG
jgi:3,4-dihydroxy 2-butanone 4-phosphate synthase / GTP cyclohydrolase II